MKEYDLIIGIDPGASGGICTYSKEVAKVYKMTNDINKLSRFFDDLKQPGKTQIVFLEKVQLWFGDSLEENRGKQFRIEIMLKGYHELKTIIKLAGFACVEVAPISWQSYLHLRKKGESKKDRKNRYKLAAQQYFPYIKATLWSSDAMCLVKFGLRKLRNDIPWVLEKLNPQKKPQKKRPPKKRILPF